MARIYLREFAYYDAQASLYTFVEGIEDRLHAIFPYRVRVDEYCNTIKGVYAPYKDDFMIVTRSKLRESLSGGWFKNPDDAMLFKLVCPGTLGE